MRVVLATAIVMRGLAWAQPPGQSISEETAACLSCHKAKDLEIDLPSEEVKSLAVDPALLSSSVHSRLGCTDCHSDLKGRVNGHDERAFRNSRQFAIVYSEQCKQCHFANYTKTLDSVHHALIAKGNERPAVCTDCHGAHDVSKAAAPRSRISKTCARCHQKIAEAYVLSVHGKSLLAEENPDVPTCTDCHRAHDIADPRAATWKLKLPQLCGNCHTDEKRMGKYGLSTKVLSTYLADFHGSTTLLEPGDKGAQVMVALCSDCHGVHDITRVRDPGSKVVQANLVKVCQKCHPGAPPGFQAAWLSHYEPTWNKARGVFAVKTLYAIFIPFMIVGLLLQIVLHLWRVVLNR